MENMLQSAYLSVLGATTVDEFREVLVRFARQMGYDTASATTVVDRLGNAMEQGRHDSQ